MRMLGIVTTGRADYSIYQPVLRRIRAEAGLSMYLLVTGMHLAPEFGGTVRAVEADGFEIGERIEMLLSSDGPEGTGKSMGLGLIGFSQAYARRRPDILVVLGDRFEMHAAALAALPFKIPVAHIHGGELTLGAIDDSLRHSLTKLSHLHFVSTEEYARRTVQLGEAPWRVTVSGAPALDNLDSLQLLDRAALESRLGFSLAQAPLLVTFHPATLHYEQAESQFGELLAALDDAGLPVIFSLPNADARGRALASKLREHVAARPAARLCENLGAELYFNLMRHAAAMVGNSSSGIIEAPSFGLPVVNVGDRQAGRVRARNVIDAACDRVAIGAGIQKALKPGFRNGLRGLANPYRRGNAAECIVARLASVELGDRLICKEFHDVSP